MPYGRSLSLSLSVCVCVLAHAWGAWWWLCMPCRTYVVMVALFFVVNVVNNQALNFNIAMPLHMIFRAVSITHLQILCLVNHLLYKT